MSSLFQSLGRKVGRVAMPAVTKARWAWQNVTGSEEDVIRAERQLGAVLAVEARAKLGTSVNAGDIALIDGLCRQLKTHVRDQRFTFSTEVVEVPEPTAMTLPGGFIFISRSLLDLCCRYPDELGFVIGHEMAHILRGHVSDRWLHDSALNLAAKFASRAGPAGSWLGETGVKLLSSAYSRDCEFEADELGSRLAKAAGHHPLAALRLFQRLEKLHGDNTPLGEYFSTHPSFAERQRRLAHRWRETTRPVGPKPA